MSHRGFDTLRDFLDTLERNGELKRISALVDPVLEVTEIAIRSAAQGGPALLFENVRGSKYPLAMNVLGSDRRVELALGIHPGELGHQLINFVEQLMPPKPSAVWNAMSPLRARLLSARVSRSSQSVRGSMSPVDLDTLPITQSWPDDGGKFITLPQVFTYDPVTGKRNVGMYRVHVFGPQETSIHWQIQKGGGFHYNQAEKLGKPFEIAIAVGTDPALLLATIAPLPENIDEVMFAGFLRGRATKMQRASKLSIDVPSNAEFVIEGIVPPFERRMEGPFGDHFGHYSHAGMFPVFHVKAITTRANPIFAATVVGKPPMEDKWLGDATQLILGPLAKLTHPEVKDVWAFYEAGFHNLLGVTANQRYAKEAMKTALSLATDGQLSLTKCAVIVSSHVNNRDFRSLLGAIRENFDPYYDFQLLQNVPLDTLDFTSYTMNMGSKVLIDATEKMTETASGGKYAPRKQSVFYPRTGIGPVDPKSLDFRIRDWRLIEDVLLVLQIEGATSNEENAAKQLEGAFAPPIRTSGREVAERFVAESNLEKLPKGTKIVAVVSEDVNLSDEMECIWGIFTRFDAARDIVFTRSGMVGISPSYEGILGIDATWKPGYPNPCVMPEQILSLVTERWKEYGF